MDPVIAYVQANVDAIPFKSLQADEPEPSNEEKIATMARVAEGDPGLFLSRWGQYLPRAILEYFQPLRDLDYEVDFYLQQLMDEPSKPQQRIVSNRRYEYLKRHLRESSYFSDDSMQQREPVLYEQYVGQYQSEQEKTMPFANDVTLVQRVLSNIDRHYASEQVRKQKIIEEEQFEEEEESEDEEEDVQDTPMSDDRTGALPSNQPAEDTQHEEAEFRESQRQELIRLLEERFLAGKDPEFDYSKVDMNEAYDDLTQQGQDMEDRYFDEEEPGIGTSTPRSTVYTGELDY
ncbi:hypothetical protein O0I10_007977 [Lichtheimia ornata]|uniref:CCD97-like C-terminal domain-containing protein n=1 Tax=Lichtheimia ornata TaxID=688661 RepID=A0AAD7UZD3_9FUNG|nr:uncharacterized protein O0I10_007977 [Lichtheimia ornata]KAJ8656409.1 hypothetical protein O0I10_007977 [Lichtheimia ornata]